jgi:lactate racemase
MITGIGSPTSDLSPDVVQQHLAIASDALALDGKRVLVIIPDATRTAPIPLLFRLLGETFGAHAAALDYLIALGTHPPMSDEAIALLVGTTASERSPTTRIFNHAWNDPTQLQTIGVIARDEAEELTEGILAADVPVTLNRMVLDYDQIVICGPVFPHEVAGFSGGAKYLFPGIAGPEIIDFTHWLGALVTSMHTIGVKQTPVRRVIHRAAQFLPRPLACIALVMQEVTLRGMYIGTHLDAFEAAADLSAQLNIILIDQPMQRILSCPATRYDDLWTAAKAMYKTEPVIADGGEVIIYAPHITEVSYTHGELIDRVGYHVRDFFLKQWERYGDIPGTILAHSTHVKGAGAYDAASGVESPRIQVTLATGISEERCRRINLGYADPAAIHPAEWTNRETEGILLVPHAGEMLYRLRDRPS